MPQGPRRPTWWTDGKKQWNHGAPLSKKAKMPGVGRGKNPKGLRPDEQLHTVPLPAERVAVANACVRDFLQEPTENKPPQVPPLPPPPVTVGLAPTHPSWL